MGERKNEKQSNKGTNKRRKERKEGRKRGRKGRRDKGTKKRTNILLSICGGDLKHIRGLNTLRKQTNINDSYSGLISD